MVDADAPEAVELFIPSWRLKLIAGFIVVYALWKLALEASSIHHDLQNINRALRAEFDATETPPVEKRRVGEYRYPPPETGPERQEDAEDEVDG